MTDSDDKWTKARDGAAQEYADKKWVVGQRAVNKDGFRAGADFGRQYERDLILSSPELRVLVRDLVTEKYEYKWNSTKEWDSEIERDIKDTLDAFKARFPGGGEN